MKFNSLLAASFLPAVLAGLLAACSTSGNGVAANAADHQAHHPDASVSAARPAQPSQPTAGNQEKMMGSTDMKSMCDMDKDMMSSKSPAERQAMMEQKMKSMPPEMREQHMKMMESNCR